jgi:hypothetical protein
MNGYTNTIFLKTYNICGTLNTFFLKRVIYSTVSIDNIMFSLHLALNTCRDKGIQSSLTIPDIATMIKYFPETT